MATLTSKSQITIPSEVRRQLGIGPGDRVIIEVEGGAAVLRALRGSFSEYMDGLGREVLEAEGGARACLEHERESWDE